MVMNSSESTIIDVVCRSLIRQTFLSPIDTPDSDGVEYKGRFVITQSTPQGILVTVTPCYSTGCLIGSTCYSSSCPNKEAVSRRPHIPERIDSAFSDKENAAAKGHWQSLVSQKDLQNMSNKEKKRQEVIFELIKGEFEYCEDLNSVINIFIEPLSHKNIVSSEKRSTFIEKVFLNLRDIYDINRNLLKMLIALQTDFVVQDGIGEGFQQLMTEFEKYILYGANQAFAKAFLKDEIAGNPELSDFLDKCRRNRVELRRLPLDSYLASPTTRFARYPLLLNQILKYTDDSHPEYAPIVDSISAIDRLLARLNEEAGKNDNLLRLSTLQSRIKLQPESLELLDLSHTDRKLVREGRLVLKRSDKQGDMVAWLFLFDHALFIAEETEGGFYKPIRKPFLLEFVDLKTGHDLNEYERESQANISESSIPHNPSSKTNSSRTSSVVQKNIFGIVKFGRDGGLFKCKVTSEAEMNSWIHAIQKQRDCRQQMTVTFNARYLMETKVNQLTAEDKEPSMVISTKVVGNHLILTCSNGVFALPNHMNTQSPTIPKDQLIPLVKMNSITQADIVETTNQLLVIADKAMWSFEINVSKLTVSRKPKKISSSASFFKQGCISNEHFVCIVDSKPRNSTIKLWKSARNHKSDGLLERCLRLITTGDPIANEVLLIPSETRSLDFLNTYVCVGSERGFEIVDVKSFQTQAFINQNDPSLAFLNQKAAQTPVTVFRCTNGQFILCFEEVSVMADKYGKRSNDEWMIKWRGTPKAFSLTSEFIVAYDTKFIEIRRVLTGDVVQVMSIKDIAGDISGDSVLQVCDANSLQFSICNSKQSKLYQLSLA